MKHTIGKNLTAGSANTIFTVPEGYKAEIEKVFIANLTASVKSVSAYWDQADSTQIDVISSYSMPADSFIQFFDGAIVFQAGDKLVITPEAGATQTTFVTFDLRKEAPINAFV